MTLARIYLTDKESGKWVPLMESPQSSDNILQLALAKSPELIPGDQISPEDPRRWLLVRPGSATADSGRLALILVDQQAIPTFVICQDSAGDGDPRQLLACLIEQATQGTTGLFGEEIRRLANETAVEFGFSLQGELARLLGSEAEEDVFWAAVNDNLHQRRLRLISVAETISAELRQMLDFLDHSMNNVEVLALEIKQYRAAGQTALYPRLVGRGKTTPIPAGDQETAPVHAAKIQAKPVVEQAATPQAAPAQVEPTQVQPVPIQATPQPKPAPAKNGSNGLKPQPDARFNGDAGSMWNTKTFFTDLSGRAEEAQVLVGRQIYNWAHKNSSRVEWGGGATRGAFAPIYKQGSRECQLFVVTSNGWVELNLKGYQAHPPYNQYDKMDRFFHKLSSIEEIDLPEEALEKRALLPLSLFTDPSRLATFLKVFEWVMVNMESSTGELQPLKKPVTPRKGNLSWPGPDVGGELKTQENNDDDFNSYESSFDALLSRKRVELDDEEPADQA